MKLDLTQGIPYLDALNAAEALPSMILSGKDDLEPEVEEAMSIVEEWCPHLWPAIDRAIVNGLNTRTDY